MMLRADFFARPNTIIKSNAPKDLQILGLAFAETYTGYPHTFEIYVSSETFDEVPEGSEPPLISPFIYTVETIDG